MWGECIDLPSHSAPAAGPPTRANEHYISLRCLCHCPIKPVCLPTATFKEIRKSKQQKNETKFPSQHWSRCESFWRKIFTQKYLSKIFAKFLGHFEILFVRVNTAVAPFWANFGNIRLFLFQHLVTLTPTYFCFKHLQSLERLHPIFRHPKVPVRNGLRFAFPSIFT